MNFFLVSIPTKTNFRGINHRESVIFEGTQGWSEFSPFLEYSAEEARTWLQASLEAAEKPWPKLYRNKIEVNATLPNVTPDRVSEILSSFDGTSTVKIKVSDYVIGSKLVAATLDYLPTAKIRLDVNGSWTLDEAITFLSQYIQKFGSVFEYIEQPVATVKELAQLKAAVNIKIAVDESIRKDLHGEMELLREVADVAIIKWQPIGGFEAAHRVAERIGLPVVVSSALETGIGISHSAALAASFEELPFACGLGTVSLLETDICSPALVAQNGFIPVNRVIPDKALLEKYRASEERYEWWQNRLSEIGGVS